MAGRFRASKYKNAVPKAAKKENWLSGVSVGSTSSCGNSIAASCRYKAFLCDPTGSSVAVLRLEEDGRRDRLPVVHAHAGQTTDLAFSPFDDALFATGGDDGSIKFWQIPDGGLTQNLSNPNLSLRGHERKIEAISFHPTANQVLASSSGSTVKLWDVEENSDRICLDGHGDTVYSVSWKGNGTQLASTGKDKMIRIFDPRSGASCTMEANGHGGVKESRILWLGDSDYIVSTGFSKMRERQFGIWDSRKMEKPLTMQSVGTSTGILLPLYDEDTKMLFLAGKADSSIRYLDLTDIGSSPHYVEGQLYRGDQETKGIAIVPKRAVIVMSCEVVRLLQLAQHNVVPISYQVPRKSYREFHADLFPDTSSGEAALTASEWFSGEDKQVTKVSLDPAKIAQDTETPKPKPSKPLKPSKPEKVVLRSEKTPSPSPSPSQVASVPAPEASASTATFTPQPAVATTPSKPFAGVRVSKFRHSVSVIMHPSNHIDGVRGLALNVPSNSNGIQVNSERIAFPLAGPGGQIAVLELNKPGRLPTSIPFLQNSVPVLDFAMNPFDNYVIAVAGDDAKIRVFRVPRGGLTEIVDTPEIVLRGHYDKINLIQFHPMAENILVTAAFDFTVKIWDLSADGEEKITLEGHSDEIFAFAWSPDGKKLATVSRDKIIRIYDPRKSVTPIHEGPGPTGSRGARIVWVSDRTLFISGFDRQSLRQLMLYNAEDLPAGPIDVLPVDSSPAILIPFFDPDTMVVHLAGKGETNIKAYEISPDESPHFLEVAPFTTTHPQQAVAFLPKTVCDVRQVEYARAVRLTKASVEPIQFRVPRAKPQYFQDDIFPETRVTWKSVLTARDWLQGSNNQFRKLSLRPEGMKLLSEAPKEAPAAKKYASVSNSAQFKSDKEKKDELVAAVASKLEEQNAPLPQDEMEGVDEDEWDD